MTRSRDEVSLVGEFERDPNPLVGILGGNPYSASPPSKIKHRVRFGGTVHGGAIFGTVNRNYDGQSSLSSVGAAQDVLLIFSVDASRFYVMENPDGDEPTFYEILVS